jgi:hypothetical protein
MSHAMSLVAPVTEAEAQSPIEKDILLLIERSSNKRQLEAVLEGMQSEAQLVQFLHRFLLFNDALAARVPLLAGLIHLSPGLFLDRSEPVAFCGMRNARIAAYVAEAAADEYHIAPRNLVHQHLSQEFLRGVMKYLGLQAAHYDAGQRLNPQVDALLTEARTRYFVERTSDDVMAALGFHTGLEFFAHEEFNVVDTFLRKRHPEMVRYLEGTKKVEVNRYLWMSLHTIVEHRHYEAGMVALREALDFYAGPRSTDEARELILSGFKVFSDLQRRFYQSILDT